MLNGTHHLVVTPRQPDCQAAAEGPSDRELLQRFAATRDEDAFGALVARHGPMVFGVCRRVLGDRNDAEDAFQITFLVLARKAGTLDRPELLGNWLYGVAQRTALRVRGRTANRKSREKQVARMPDLEGKDGPGGQEALGILDEELNQLPERYRILIVLCYLEGKTHEEAASIIGCPRGSMAWRLERARSLLRKRLAHRGLALASGLPALLLFAQTAQLAALPGQLAEATTRAAVAYAANGAPAVSTHLAALTDEILSKLVQKARSRRALGIGLAALLALLAAGLLAYQVWGQGLFGKNAPWGAKPTPGSGCGSPLKKE
jgi:RNA polymerase sigma factor (sigma-70 family)